MTIVRRCGHGEGLRSLAQSQAERNGRQVALSLYFMESKASRINGSRSF